MMGKAQGGATAHWMRWMPVVFVLIWSTGFIVARYAMPYAPPLKFLAARYALSSACFLVWVLLAGVRWPRSPLQLMHLAITGLLMQAGYLGGVWAAVKAGMGSGLTALLVGMQPVLTAVWLSARGGRVGARQWLGLWLGFAGLVLVVWNKLGMGGEVTPLTMALATMALLSITAGTLYQKHFVAPCDVRPASAVQQIAALAITLPFALALEAEAIVWNIESIGAMAWSVLALTLGGSSLLYMLIQRGTATAVTSLLYLVPPCTALMAWLLFDEPVTAITIVGIVLSASGVSLVLRGTRGA